MWFVKVIYNIGWSGKKGIINIAVSFTLGVITTHGNTSPTQTFQTIFFKAANVNDYVFLRTDMCANQLDISSRLFYISVFYTFSDQWNFNNVTRTLLNDFIWFFLCDFCK